MTEPRWYADQMRREANAETIEPGAVFLAGVNDAAEVLTACEALDVDAIVELPEPDALRAWTLLEEAHRILAGVRSQVMGRVAENMSGTEVTVDGVGTFTRHVLKARTQWDKDDLLRAVLDSRIVDKQTGEVLEETPVQKVLAVWNLATPRVTALRDREIDADQFCTTEKRGYTIERI